MALNSLKKNIFRCGIGTTQDRKSIWKNRKHCLKKAVVTQYKYIGRVQEIILAKQFFQELMYSTSIGLALYVV